MSHVSKKKIFNEAPEQCIDLAPRDFPIIAKNRYQKSGTLQTSRYLLLTTRLWSYTSKQFSHNNYTQHLLTSYLSDRKRNIGRCHCNLKSAYLPLIDSSNITRFKTKKECLHGLVECLINITPKLVKSIVLSLYYFCKSHCGPNPELWIDSGINKLSLYF